METIQQSLRTCIYCAAEVYDEFGGRLHDEHVIPLSLNGRIILSEASCRACENLINKFEARCNRVIFGPTRYYLKLPTRSPKHRPESLPVNLFYGSLPFYSIDVPISEYPLILAMFRLDYPKITGLSEPSAGRSLDVIVPAGEDKMEEMRHAIALKWYAKSCVLDVPIAKEELRHLIAKIAHGQAVYVLGLGGFRPILQDYIIGKNDADGEWYVGSEQLIKPRSTGLHEIFLDTRRLGHDLFLIARVRLFSYFNSLEYVAFVGTLEAETALPEAAYVEAMPVDFKG